MACVRWKDGVQLKMMPLKCKRAHTYHTNTSHSLKALSVIFVPLSLSLSPTVNQWMWTTSLFSSKTVFVSLFLMSPGKPHKPKLKQLKNINILWVSFKKKHKIIFLTQRELSTHNDSRTNQEMYLPSREGPPLPHLSCGGCAELHRSEYNRTVKQGKHECTRSLLGCFKLQTADL